jgi:dTDP-glucose 4,6-dehydratase
MHVLVTGGAGFIGANFVRLLLEEEKGYDVVVLDKLTYAGNLKNLEGLDRSGRYEFVRGDVADSAAVGPIMDRVDAVVHFAAESHVDRSILDATDFVRTNVLGTLALLQEAQRAGVKRYVQVSTDEVYGSLGPEGKFSEQTPISPNSPYSASKAGADLIVRSFHHTFGFPAIITRCSNNYGPYQFPEKVIPLFIANALEDKPVPLYGDGLNVRDWIHVHDHCRALLKVLSEGRAGEVYNIGGNAEITNLELTRTVLKLLDKPESLIKRVKDRPGHDRRYAMDISKIRRELGWAPEYSFERGIAETVRWYRENRPWWEEVRSGQYMDYYKKWYGDR